MDIILETDRLILREIEQSDSEALFEMDRNPNVHRYLWNKPLTNIAQTQSYIESIKKQYKDFKIGRFAVVLKENNKLIGWCGLKYNTEMVNKKVNFYDIGYRLNEKYWGKGYATEASIPWVDYAFDVMNVKKIEAAAHIDNKASNAILQKIGLHFTNQYIEDAVMWNWYELNNPNRK